MSSSKRSTRRKPRQTRLDFTPLPSSSPAAANLSPDVGHRAAAVDYTGSPSPVKRRKITGGDGAVGGTTHAALPTPEKSSQLRSSATLANAFMGQHIRSETGLGFGDSSDSDSEPVPRSHRKRNNVDSSKRSPPNKTRSTVKEESKSLSEGGPDADSSSEDIPTRRRTQPVTPTSRSSRSKKKASPEAPGISPPADRRQTRASQRSIRSRKAVINLTDDDTDELEVVGGPSNRPQDSGFGEAESSGDDVLASSPGSMARKNRKKKNVPEVYSEEEESEDEIPVSTRKRRPRPALDSDEDPVVGRQRRRSPSTIRQEQVDLEEDLEFLGSSPRKLDVSRRPNSAPRAMNARQKALEALKRRRAGEKDPSSEDEEQSLPRRRRALYDTESELESLPDEEEDEEDEAGEDDENDIPDGPHATVHQATTMDMFQEDDDDENFVIESDDEAIGVPNDSAMLPLEFSSLGRAKAKDLFKYAVDWMVQKKLNPRFDIRNEVYDLAFRKLDDEVRGLAGSKFTSSAWTRDFTKALHARPEILITEIAGTSRLLLEDHCGACNRRKHPAKFDVQFSGKAYKRDTLSDVDSSSDSEDDDDDEDEDEDDDNVSYDADGNPIPPDSTVFHVGVFCKTNAETAHTLAHWRHHLNSWVVGWLEIQGHLDPDKIVERDGWKTKKRNKYAIKIVDEMQASGEIKRLYQDFRSSIDHAREAKQAGWFSR